MKKTKIIATLGPSSSGRAKLGKIAAAGMDAVRLNFSHGTHSEYTQIIKDVRAVAAGEGRPLAIIADIQGPKIRVGEVGPGGVSLSKSEMIKLSSLAVPRARRVEIKTIPVSYRKPGGVLSVGDKVLLDDGRLVIKVTRVLSDAEVQCRVIKGGTLKSRKGINLPGKDIDLPSLTPKDRKDIEFALAAGVDYLAQSFIRTAGDVIKLRKLAGRLTDRKVRIIAKIEKREAIENIDEIISEADAVMIARGDLGVEIAPERVPYWQKELIRKARSQARTVITATQMLESMIENPTPTRAEASDVANAVYDGTDCVMLSGETAVGKYPVAAVRTMNRITRTVERSLPGFHPGTAQPAKSVTRVISAAACEVADSMKARAIVTPTSSGTTAYEISKHRPKTPIIAISSDHDVVNQLSLAWGVLPGVVAPAKDTEDMFAKAIAAAVAAGLAGKGDMIVITAGVLVNVPGTTNLIKIHKIDV